MKKILITGDKSYIGDSVKEYLLQEPDKYLVTTKDTMGWTPKASDFSGFDVVFNVAGIAHIKETPENKKLFFEVNRNLIIRIAKAAKRAGVGQFVLLSSMSVYGILNGHITKHTPAKPINAYGKSKVQADEAIKKLEDENFKFACLRPPMVYGKGCKGNYQSLRKFALKSPVFPRYHNDRSMIFIGNLCDFIKRIIDEDRSGLFFPQNAEYVNTSNMVKLISQNNGKHIRFTKVFNWLIKIMPFSVFKKVFGSLTYEPVDKVYKYDFKESIRLSETE